MRDVKFSQVALEPVRCAARDGHDEFANRDRGGQKVSQAPAEAKTES